MRSHTHTRTLKVDITKQKNLCESTALMLLRTLTAIVGISAAAVLVEAPAASSTDKVIVETIRGTNDLGYRTVHASVKNVSGQSIIILSNTVDQLFSEAPYTNFRPFAELCVRWPDGQGGMSVVVNGKVVRSDPAPTFTITPEDPIPQDIVLSNNQTEAVGRDRHFRDFCAANKKPNSYHVYSSVSWKYQDNALDGGQSHTSISPVLALRPRGDVLNALEEGLQLH